MAVKLLSDEERKDRKARKEKPVFFAVFAVFAVFVVLTVAVANAQQQALTPVTDQAAVDRGKSLLELMVYDGSDNGQKVYNTLSVIGQAIPPDKTTRSPDPSTTNAQMKSLTRWPVTVSYYDRDVKKKDGEQTPVYAMSFELFENGVSRALVLDYNDFVISGALGKFDIKDAKPCK